VLILELLNKYLNYTWTVDRTEYRFHMNRTQPDLLMDGEKLNDYDVYFVDGVEPTVRIVAQFGDINQTYTRWRAPFGLNCSPGNRFITFNTHQMIMNLKNFIENESHGYVAKNR
jgi:hypothetical protein